jgi:hypothetical protein
VVGELPGSKAMVAVVILVLVIVFLLLSLQPGGTQEQDESTALDFSNLATALPGDDAA